MSFLRSRPWAFDPPEEDENGIGSPDCAQVSAGTRYPHIDDAGRCAVTGKEMKANGRIRTDNPWFTKPELCH
jgi:hypothetical protein